MAEGDSAETVIVGPVVTALSKLGGGSNDDDDAIGVGGVGRGRVGAIGV